MKSIVYHNIKNFDKKCKYDKFLSIKNFNKQIIFLKKNFKFFDCYNLFHKNFLVKKNNIFLTFDDGLKNHYDNVYPILKKNNLNAIFYIPYNPIINKKILDVHKINMVLGKYPSKSVDAYLNKIVENKMLQSSKRFRSAYLNFSGDLLATKIKKKLNYEIKHEYKNYVINKLFNFFYKDINEKIIVKKYYLSMKDIKIMSKNNMIIGSHSTSHPVLSNVPEKSFMIEIKTGVDYFSHFNQNYYKTFSYPYGIKNSYNTKIINYLNNLKVNFSMIVSNKDISSNVFHNNPQELPRYDCKDLYKFKV